MRCTDSRYCQNCSELPSGRRTRPPLAPGDVVLVDMSTNMMKKFRISRVVEVKEGGRTAVAKFKLSDEVKAKDNEISTRRLLKVNLPEHT
jgi:hypothetical protein